MQPLFNTWMHAFRQKSRKASFSSGLSIATGSDSQNLFSLMDCRQGSLITDKTILTKYNQDWTVRDDPI